MEKAKIIKEYLKKESEKEKQLQETNHKDKVEKLRQAIEDTDRLKTKATDRKQKELTNEIIRDMYYRCGMKRALQIVEGKDDE